MKSQNSLLVIIALAGLLWLAGCAPSLSAPSATEAMATEQPSAAVIVTEAMEPIQPSIGAATSTSPVNPSALNEQTEGTAGQGETPFSFATQEAQPAPTQIIEKRQIELEWPANLPLGESDVIRLALIPSENGYQAEVEFPEHDLEVESIPVEFSQGYSLAAEARLDGVGFEIAPQNTQSHYLETGTPLTFRWSITARSPGKQRLAIEVTFIWTPMEKESGESRSVQVFSDSLNVNVTSTLGLTRSQALGTGFVSLITGMGFAITGLLGYSAKRKSLLRFSPADSGVLVEQPAQIQLAGDEKSLLQVLFRGYGRILVQKEFLSGYSGARTILVVPVHSNGNSDAATIVKMNWREAIEREYLNYETFVKDRLPPLTARIQHRPVTISPTQRRAALRYTFLAEPGKYPISLRLALLENPSPDLIFKLFDSFAPNWWMQRSPYVFRLSQEYDSVLPAHLILEPDQANSQPKQMINPAIADLTEIRPGQLIRVAPFEHFEPRADGKSWTLYSNPQPGLPAFRFRWNDPKLPANSIAKVCADRNTLLHQWIAALNVPNTMDLVDLLNKVLNETVYGTRSIIHGDLNLENILIGPGNLPWLIDFSETRQGHPLFDFTHLATEIIAHVYAEIYHDPVKFLDAMHGRRLDLLNAIDEIALRCLFNPAIRREFYLTWFVSCMGTLKYPNLNSHAKELLFLTALDIAQTHLSS